MRLHETDRLTVELLSAIGYGTKPNANLGHLLICARKNKVLLHLLRALNIQGTLREEQESHAAEIKKVVQTLSKLLGHYDYAFFKLIKPVSYVPADVDLLVSACQAKEVAKEIMKLGYEAAVKDPYCITLTKGGSIIDVYVHPSLGGVAFINGQRLLEHTRIVDFEGVEIRSLESYAEALAVASHAIYKERIYTLNDFFTVKEWTSSKTLTLAQELNCESAVELAVNLNEKIRLGAFEAPYKVPVPLWLTMLLRKFGIDDLTRATSIGMLKTLIGKRAGKLFISKFTRETY